MSQTLISRIRLLGAAILFASAAATAQMPAQIDGEPVPSLAPLVERVAPAVVNIRVSQRVTQTNPFGDDPFWRFFGGPSIPGGAREAVSAGSGVIVDADNGYILTNHHVVSNADEIQVSLIDGDVLDAEIVGSDPATDIALIKVDADHLVDMPIGDSDDVRVGDFVLAIGNPFGLGNSVTSGIISALGRTGINRNGYEDFIQTDASINPGNSGGALVNMHGELIGINSAIISQSGGNVGIGFAVPTEIASSIMRQILDYGEVRRGLLGVTIQGIDAEVAQALNSTVDRGALITEIVPGSAAEKSGLRVDDIIVAVDDEKITSATDLRNAIGLKGSGEEVVITYIRDGKTSKATAELGRADLASTEGNDMHPGLEGAQFSTFHASNGSEAGVEVTAVVPDSPAAQRGIRAGDIITQVNRTPVRNLEQFRAIAGANRILFLRVERDDRLLMLQIR